MSKCKSCYYHDLHVGSCDYILLTGRRRGCAAEDCDKWFPKNGKRKREDVVFPDGRYTVSKWSRMHDAMRMLHERGLSDRQIAEKIGCSFKTVANWRNKEKLPPVSKGGRPRKR